MFLVCLGDIASAAIIAPILIIVMDYHTIATVFVVIAAMIVSVSPDLDIPLSKLFISSKPEHISNHRDMLHIPLAIIPIFAVLYYFSAFWAYLVGLCLLAHFIHDSLGSGYGVKWLQPLSQNSYKFCPEHIICWWTPEYVKKHPITMTLDEALEKYYLKWTSESIPGVILAIVAIVMIKFW
jgi:hypothetical protein